MSHPSNDTSAGPTSGRGEPAPGAQPLRLIPPPADHDPHDVLDDEPGAAVAWFKRAHTSAAAFNQVGAASAAISDAVEAEQRQVQNMLQLVHTVTRLANSGGGGRILLTSSQATTARDEAAPLSQAAHIAEQARTKEEFGAALTLLRKSHGLSLKALKKVLDDAEQWTAQSTLSRACSGQNLFRDRDTLAAFVIACGVDHELEVWVQAWERLREHQRQARTAGTNATTGTVPAAEETSSAAEEPAAASVVDLDRARQRGRERARRGAGWLDDDEVLGEIRVPYTRGHLRTAVVLLAVSGLTATTASTPVMRNAGVIALGLAAGLALYEALHPTAPLTA